MLTSKVKQDFLLWLSKQDYANRPIANAGHELTDFFDELPLAAQVGIFQDYFQHQHGIFPEVGYAMDMEDVLYFYAEIFEKSNYECDVPLQSLFEEDLKTMNEARKTAIQKASQIVEQRL